MHLHGLLAVWLRICIVLYILLLGLITLVVGPASAVLLLPRTTVSSSDALQNTYPVQYVCLIRK